MKPHLALLGPELLRLQEVQQQFSAFWDHDDTQPLLSVLVSSDHQLRIVGNSAVNSDSPPVTAICETVINAFGSVYCALQAFETGHDDTKLTTKSHGRRCLVDFVELLSQQPLIVPHIVSHMSNIVHGSALPRSLVLAAIAAFAVLLFECHANRAELSIKNSNAKDMLIQMMSYYNRHCCSRIINWWTIVISAYFSFSAVRLYRCALIFLTHLLCSNQPQSACFNYVAN